jgi:hypothetical protein
MNKPQEYTGFISKHCAQNIKQFLEYDSVKLLGAGHFIGST